MQSSPVTFDASLIPAEFFRQLCDQVGIAVIATDPQLRIRTWNAAAARMFGAGADLMIDTSILSVIPQDRRPAAEKMFQRALTIGDGGELEFQHRDAAGEARELSGSIAPIVNESGTRIGASVCIRDITKRMRLATELHENRKMAALGEMAGAIAHHFNNILGGIVTSIDYAGSSNDPTVVQRVLGQANRSLVRASALVNGLLAFAASGAHTDDLCDLTELLNELAEELEESSRKRGVRFELSLGEIPVVAVPRVQLLTILRNISQNALEAMPDGGLLAINADIKDESVRVSIRDTGRGLDDETRRRMFEPFWTTKQPGVGTSQVVSGLGLAIAYGLSQVIGATIDVESELNKGSRFVVTLPRHSATPMST